MTGTYQAPTQHELDTVRGPRPGTQALAMACVKHYPGMVSLGIYNRRPMSGADPGPLTVHNASTHAVGRGLDLRPVDRKQGDDLACRLLVRRNWHALGIGELIWQKHRTTEPGNGQPYTGPDDHTGHLHISNTIEWADLPQKLSFIAAVIEVVLFGRGG